jgi:glutamyl-tRNA synthetase
MFPEVREISRVITVLPTPLSGIRFAPSPTGRFHIGNLRTAWISEQFARVHHEPWIIRFEDIDTPRILAGARENQLADLAVLGLVPDKIYLQSARRSRHFVLFERAVADGTLYPCSCSRKEIQDALSGIASAPHGAIPIYTGHCRNSPPTTVGSGTGGIAWRFRSTGPSGVQDFIVARTSGLRPDETSFVPAYHWACAIDDFDGSYRLLVRAWDLASSTPLQREIQSWVARSEGKTRQFAAVFHAALVTANDGHRLEKRTAGVTLAELLTSGWTSERIRERFSASFRLPTGMGVSEQIFGEIAHERTLADLGFLGDDPAYA